MYVAACHTLTSPDALARLTREVIEDSARDGAAWIEPAVYLPHHNARLGPSEEVLEIILGAAADAASANDIGVGVVVAADRTVDPADASSRRRSRSSTPAGASSASGSPTTRPGIPPEPFAEAFAIAREAGLLSVPHAGELDGPASVRGALDALGADRVQHGVRAIEDPELVRRLADSPVCLDVCPTSNVLLSVVPDIAAHPLPALLDAGRALQPQRRRPAALRPEPARGVRARAHALGLDDATLAHIATCSIDASGAPAELKRRARAGIAAWLAPRLPGSPDRSDRRAGVR